LLECPRRYQYEAVWLTSGLRESLLKAFITGAQPPYTKSGRMSADEWGNQIHEALRRWEFSLGIYSDQSLIDYMDQLERVLGTKARAEIAKALTNFSKLAVGKMAIDAARNNRELIKEKTLKALISWDASSPPILVQGRFDLLFQNQKGEWILVDFKAEEAPPQESFRARIYHRQIDAYAWLIANALGLKVSNAYLAYVHPNASEEELTPNEKKFEAQAKSSLSSLALDPKKGLKATPSYTPDGPCQSCPYNKEVGGPCEK
jgi:CRISPR/Cas system-associated exonuclease Cas4 (RecB family)